MSSEGSPPAGVEQDLSRFTVADFLTALRLPLAVAFIVLPDWGWRLAIILVASGSDLLDGILARRFGSSRLGSFLDPVADKLFMVAAFSVVAWSGKLALYEIAGVLLRDVAASLAFLITAVSGHPMAIPARLGGKAVTVGQFLTLLAFVADSSLLRPIAWATAGIGIYAIWDYRQAARSAGRALGS